MQNCQYCFIILAAGLGTRMKSELPKVMHSIAGLSMIGHVIQLAKNFTNNDNIYVVSRPDAKILNNYLSVQQVQIAWQDQQLGTAHAVMEALKIIDYKKYQKIVILYGDTPLIQQSTLEKLINSTDENLSLNICAFEEPNPNQYGRLVVNEQNIVEEIIEFKIASSLQQQITLCNSGIIAGLMEPFVKLIKQINNNNLQQEYLLTDIVKNFNQENLKVGFVKSDLQEFMGVNNRVELSQAEEAIQNRLRTKFMYEGVTLIDPSSVYFNYDTKIAKDVIIYPNVIFGEKVIIETGSIIKSFCSISNAHIKNAIVGEFAKIRDQVILNENSQIGSFVEVKSSSIGKNSKAKHLSYLGDVEIGENVNIGAGTIFCNYDGVLKNKSRIDDGVFIGANSAIIAPVIINNNAFIAAGSVVVKNVAENDLVITRAEELHFTGKAKILRERKLKQKLS